jgi:hypothetical protein
MSPEDTKALPLLAAYGFAAEHGLGPQAQTIRELPADSVVRRGHFVSLFEGAGIFAEFCSRHWAFSATPEGAKKLSRYRRAKEKFEESSPEGIDPATEASDEESDVFALESHLRDFLASHLDRVEPGLTLVEHGVEYAITGGRIDILAKGSDGKFVVIELKVSRGRNKTVGQILHYMGWVDKELGNGPCRGYIIANKIPDDLQLAVSRAPGIRLAEYKLDFAIKPL